MPFKKGYIMSEGVKEKVRQAKLGDKNPMWGKKPPASFAKGHVPWNKGVANENIRGKNHPNWIGDKVTYIGIHAWIARQLGRPNKCDECGNENYKRYHWHNVDGKYERDFKKWVRLCSKCHAHIHKNWLKGDQGKLRFMKKSVQK